MHIYIYNTTGVSVRIYWHILIIVAYSTPSDEVFQCIHVASQSPSGIVGITLYHCTILCNATLHSFLIQTPYHYMAAHFSDQTMAHSVMIAF